jgi:hypothetical protein
MRDRDGLRPSSAGRVWTLLLAPTIFSLRLSHKQPCLRARSLRLRPRLHKRALPRLWRIGTNSMACMSRLRTLGLELDPPTSLNLQAECELRHTAAENSILVCWRAARNLFAHFFEVL